MTMPPAVSAGGVSINSPVFRAGGAKSVRPFACKTAAFVIQYIKEGYEE